ncbi:MAG: PTS sugar transporter subunit IIA [Mariprofundaceae bacterium]
MIGIVLIGHASIASEMKNAVEHVLGKQAYMESLDVLSSTNPDALQQQLSLLIRRCDCGHGTLLFADMFGGTPCNVALSCLKPGLCEVISGFNLPALIKATSDRTLCQENHKLTLHALAQDIVHSGQQYLCLASDLMKESCRPATSDLAHD